MSYKNLCISIRFATIVAVGCGLFLLWSSQLLIEGLSSHFLEWCAYNSVYPTVMPWRIILLIASLPCFGVLACVWAVSNAISTNTVFTTRTAKWIWWSAFLLFVDAGFIFLANVVMFILSYSHPGVLLVSLILTVVLIALGLLAANVRHIVFMNSKDNLFLNQTPHLS